MGVVGSHYSNLSESERMELLRDAANQLIGKEKLSLLEPELYGPGEVSRAQGHGLQCGQSGAS